MRILYRCQIYIVKSWNDSNLTCFILIFHIHSLIRIYSDFIIYLFKHIFFKVTWIFSGVPYICVVCLFIFSVMILFSIQNVFWTRLTTVWLYFLLELKIWKIFPFYIQFYFSFMWLALFIFLWSKVLCHSYLFQIYCFESLFLFSAEKFCFWIHFLFLFYFE